MFRIAEETARRIVHATAVIEHLDLQRTRLVAVSVRSHSMRRPSLAVIYAGKECVQETALEKIEPAIIARAAVQLAQQPVPVHDIAYLARGAGVRGAFLEMVVVPHAP